jgi:8-oxo-dGTP diphosphatase
MHPEIIEKYGNKTRVRVCGLCCSGKDWLMVNHKGLTDHNFWAPPGGGVDFGDSLEQALKKEFLEETGIEIKLIELLFVTEHIEKPLHAIELFFLVEQTGGKLTVGRDPETHLRVIDNVAWLPNSSIGALPDNQKHKIFASGKGPADCINMRGYIQLL